MLPGSYLQGMRTPDGPMVVLHAPGSDCVTLPEAEYDWGDVNLGALLLAELLLDCAHQRRPHPIDRDDFAKLVVAKLPRAGWKLTPAEIRQLDEQKTPGVM